MRRRAPNIIAGKALSLTRSLPMKHDEKPAPTVAAAPMTEKQRRLDRLLDEALEETFPGSDPVAISQPAPDDRLRRRK
jgi:hypothetical protein